jgi:hypothetical protein
VPNSVTRVITFKTVLVTLLGVTVTVTVKETEMLCALPKVGAWFACDSAPGWRTEENTSKTSPTGLDGFLGKCEGEKKMKKTSGH